MSTYFRYYSYTPVSYSWLFSFSLPQASRKKGWGEGSSSTPKMLGCWSSVSPKSWFFKKKFFSPSPFTYVPHAYIWHLKTSEIAKSWPEAEIPVQSDSASLGGHWSKAKNWNTRKWILFTSQPSSTPEKKSLEGWTERWSAGSLMLGRGWGAHLWGLSLR